MMVNEAGRIASCCSLQTALGPPEYRKWRRMHGLQLPLHPQQVAGWFALLLSILLTFGVLVPALGSTLRLPLFILLSSLYIVHVTSHVFALVLDPADPHLRALKNTKIAVPEFDRAKHAHVIENGRCHLCNIRTTNARTKHCSVCNKCVERFDHHCKWLNHCVGGRNYMAFLVCVISAVITAIVTFVLSIMELVFYHVDPVLLSPWEHSDLNSTQTELTTTLKPFEINILLVTVSCMATIAAVSAGLLLHLCLFHLYISSRGITTYEYIRNFRHHPGRNNTVAPSMTNSTLQLPIESGLSSGRSRRRRDETCCNTNELTLSNSRIEPSSNKRCHCGHDTIVEETSPINPRRFCWYPPSICDRESRLNCLAQFKKNDSSVVEKSTEALASYEDTPVNYLKSSRGASEMKESDKRTNRVTKLCLTESADIEDNDSPGGGDASVNNSKQRTTPEIHNSNCNNFLTCSCLKHQRVPTVPTVLVRGNQVRPSEELFIEKTKRPLRQMTHEQDKSTIVPTKRMDNTLPALAPPKRRQIRNVLDLKELSDALAHVASLSQSEDIVPTEVIKMAFTQRKPIRKNVHRDPTLSPIRESGFSNPSSPQLSTTRLTESVRRDQDIFIIRSPRLSPLSTSSSKDNPSELLS